MTATDSLDAAIATVHAEISRTDTKAGHLLASFGLPLAVLVAVVPEHRMSAAAGTLVGAGAIGLVAAMLVVLVVVQPRLSHAARGGWVYWASCTPDELIADLQAPTSRAEQVIHLAQIARRKYTGLRVAGVLTGASLVSLAAGLLAALI
ncbi:Pycsar system effector family protein [Streptomyces sp. NPDC057545]|uniref:Pycsar system effector family protein n=1 Tax=Streptomyces sp. NPDC057545 TaxID=3346164 RepID=UPI0036ACBA60